MDEILNPVEVIKFMTRMDERLHNMEKIGDERHTDTMDRISRIGARTGRTEIELAKVVAALELHRASGNGSPSGMREKIGLAGGGGLLGLIVEEVFRHILIK